MSRRASAPRWRQEGEQLGAGHVHPMSADALGGDDAGAGLIGMHDGRGPDPVLEVADERAEPTGGFELDLAEPTGRDGSAEHVSEQFGAAADR